VSRGSARAAALAALLGAAGLPGCAAPAFVVKHFAASRQAASDALIREETAHHIGVLAYVYGYPLVDMHRQMHNETHRVAPDQLALAPVNHFFVFPELVTPRTQGNLRNPNNDTLYLSGWFDFGAEPVILHVPDTADRYYTLGIMDFFSEVQHIGRRATGTREGYFALVAPGWQGELPAGVTPVAVPTPKAWVLGRVLVDGPEDLPRVQPLLAEFWAARLSQWRAGVPPARPELASAAGLDPLEGLDYFAAMNRELRQIRAKPREASLLALFDQIGVGPGSVFDAAALDPDTRRGLLRALGDGRALVAASVRRSQPNVHNGWIIPLALGVFGDDYLMRAANALGGYSNLPEETIYAAMAFAADGGLLSGSATHRLRFRAGELPPVGAFWSLSAYDLETRGFAANEIERYSIGDRTRGLRYGEDGSLELWLSHREPEAGRSNWLPTPSGPMLLVLRMYEPDPSVRDGSYRLPRLEQIR